MKLGESMLKKPLHSGHRSRIRDKFVASEFDNFNDHEIIEMLLFYSIPRVDTNPIAHELLNHFGSLSSVLDSTIESLKDFGLSERSATFLNMIPELSMAYICDKNYNHKKIFRESAFKKRVVSYYLRNQKNVILLALFDATGTELFFGPFLYDDNDVLASKFTNLSMKYCASSSLICTRSNSGLAVPSIEDIETITSICNSLNSINVWMKNWYVVSDTDLKSMSGRQEYSHLFVSKKQT